MGIIYNGDSDAAAVQRLVHLVTWCRVGVQFLKALDDNNIKVQCSAKVIADHPTHYAGGPLGGTMNVNLDMLNTLSTGKQAAIVLHELFHCTHRHLHQPSYKYRVTIGGELGKGLGGWVSGNAEEQLAITGYFVAQGNPDGAIRDWVKLGFCENRVLKHLGYPLRNRH